MDEKLKKLVALAGFLLAAGFCCGCGACAGVCVFLATYTGPRH